MSISLEKRTLNEGAARYWATLFRGITTLGLIAGAGYTALQYFAAKTADAQKQLFQTRVAEMEARKPFFAKRLDLCAEAANATGLIATAPKGSQRTAEADFWRLYWGPLAMVEDSALATAMIEFGECLAAKTANCSLRDLSLAVAHACREEVSTGWNLDLGPLPAKR